MILADENVHSHIVRTLQAAGFDVVIAGPAERGAKDEQVIDKAIHFNLLLLTEDKDFGEWVFAHHVKDLSVLFLRYSFAEYRDIADTLVRLLQTQTLERPFFATVTTQKIRIRKL